VKPFLLSILLVTAPAVPVLVSTTALSQSATPPSFVVKPSGFDERTEEAKAREDRLLRRLERDDYLFRNICVHCGGGVNRAGSNAPFNPMQALSLQARRELEANREIQAEP
jgi:hypothetical protein